MSADFSNVTHGPANVLIDDTALGHTQGGVSATVSPQNRPRNVDQYGASECDIIHTGDEVRVNVPLTEWTAATLAQIYNPGNDQTAAASGDTYLGIGRSAGFLYTKADMKIVPVQTAYEDLKLQFYKTTPIGDFELGHTAEDDRIFEVEHAALVDATKDDGELIGKAFLTVAA